MPAEFQSISDTAFWVAHYRAEESKRSDALFIDQYAGILTADKGERFARYSADSAYVNWTVIIRTHVIDQMIRNLVAEGVDTVINLGAGLDTRPYRMNLPKEIHWVEIDYPQIIALKEEKLANMTPTCKLSRFAIDVADEQERKKVLSEINKSARKALVLTEGVLLYLTEEEVSTLAKNLRDESTVKYWIAEYHSTMVYKHLRSEKKNKAMGKAPFKFFPDEWIEFFNVRSWKLKEIKYLVEEAKKLNRSFPLPFVARVFRFLIPPKKVKEFQKMYGFMILEKKT